MLFKHNKLALVYHSFISIVVRQKATIIIVLGACEIDFIDLHPYPLGLQRRCPL